MFSKKMKTIVGIEGMSCEHCANKVKTTLESLDKVSSVKVNLAKKEAVIASTEKLDSSLIKNAVEELGYKVTSIVEK